MVLRSPLYENQVKLGAKFTEFAGFEMPIQYSTIREEHFVVRKKVGLFDVSHMSNVWITGSDAAKLISLTTVEDASRVDDGKSQYTAILRENGTIIDDTIFMHLNEKFMMIPNAGMNQIVTKWLNEQAKKHHLKAKAEDVSREYVILAIQGPKSKETLQKVTDVNLDNLKFFGCQIVKVAGVECILSHTGYTGELGFELQITPTKKAAVVFDALLSAGAEFGIQPIGLGARDTLRLEKAFMLAGNEFEGGRTPLEATLGWTIFWDHEFIGKEALLKQKEQGTYQRMTCLECDEKGIPRHKCEIQKDGTVVGMVTSGTLSPCLNVGIAMGYVAPDKREVGSILDIMVRDKPVKAKVMKPPFVPKDWAQKQEEIAP
ncbi:MAG: glycine cleavage system aminomethyltransferase GcvT [Thermoplasmata archaeon]|nr:glycine cleavage system aminomethyltransferase GcvT [Thermoplasmata archaeon]